MDEVPHAQTHDHEPTGVESVDRVLADVASAWSSTGDLGHVQGGQYGGYLFPMGPFFALGHLLGVGP